MTIEEKPTILFRYRRECLGPYMTNEKMSMLDIDKLKNKINELLGG